VVARPLSLTVEQAALGIHRIVNAQISEGIRFVSIRQGHDRAGSRCCPRGRRALHACALADELGLGPRPRSPSSGGPVCRRPAGRAGRARGLRRPAAAIDTLDLAEVRSTLDQLDGRCRELMAQENVAAADVTRRYFADVCYAGQGYHLEVPFEPGASQPLAPSRRHSTQRTTEPTATHQRRPSGWSTCARCTAWAGASSLQDDWTPAPEPALIARRASCCGAAFRRRGRRL